MAEPMTTERVARHDLYNGQRVRCKGSQVTGTYVSASLSQPQFAVVHCRKKGGELLSLLWPIDALEPAPEKPPAPSLDICIAEIEKVVGEMAEDDRWDDDAALYGEVARILHVYRDGVSSGAKLEASFSPEQDAKMRRRLMW